MLKKKRSKLPGKRFELNEKKKEKMNDKRHFSMHPRYAWLIRRQVPVHFHETGSGCFKIFLRYVVNTTLIQLQLINQNAVVLLLATFAISDARKVSSESI